MNPSFQGLCKAVIKMFFKTANLISESYGLFEPALVFFYLLSDSALCLFGKHLIYVV